jgi:hypothetical protein
MRYFFIGFIFILPIIITFSVRAEDFKLFYDNGKVGLSDAAGNVVIPAKYEQLGWSNGLTMPNNNAIGYKSGEYWGILGLDGEAVTETYYTKLYPAGESLYIASKKGRITNHDFLGVITKEGKSVLPFKYTSIELTGLRAIVGIKYGRSYQYGVVDLGDKMIIPIKYKAINALGNLRFSIQNFESKTAIYNDIGKEVIGFTLDSISTFINGHATIFVNHLRGLININGQILAQPIYKEVRYDAYPEVKIFDQWQIVKDTEAVVSWEFDHIEPYNNDKYKVSANGKQWLINRDGKANTAMEFSHIGAAINGKMVFQHHDKWGVLNTDGTELLGARFDSLVIINDVFYAKNNNEWHLFDSFGVKKSNNSYDEIGNKSGYYFPVKRRGYWGFIDREGEEVLPCVYDKVGEYFFNKVVVKFHGEYGIINKGGDWIVYPRKKKLKIINNDLYMEFDSRLSTLRSFENETIYFTENKVDIMGDHLLEHLSDGGLWKIDFNGRIVNKRIPSERFDEIRQSTDGLFAVKKNNKFGFVDNLNRLIIANRYENVGDFSEGLVAMQILGRWGFIDKQENIVVQPLYDEVLPFRGGLSIVKNKSGYGIIDNNGKPITSFDYDQIIYLNNGRYIMKRAGKYGLIDNDGSLLVNAKYDSLEDLGNGSVLVSLFGKFGVITKRGVDIIPINYDELLYDARFGEYLVMKKSSWEKVTD